MFRKRGLEQTALEVVTLDQLFLSRNFFARSRRRSPAATNVPSSRARSPSPTRFAAAAAMLAASVHYPIRGAVTFKSTVGTNVASDALANLALDRR